jgi:hypothetical protein
LREGRKEGDADRWGRSVRGREGEKGGREWAGGRKENGPRGVGLAGFLSSSFYFFSFLFQT